MDALWRPINEEEWASTPCVAGRAANELDVSEGRAVFHIPGGAEAADLPIPGCAIQQLASGEGIPVVVVQAEHGPSGIILGVRPLSGGNGLCMLSEVELLPGGFSPQHDG